MNAKIEKLFMRVFSENNLKNFERFILFFATIGFLYSCILMVHGWRLDPILLFSQVLIIITVLVAGWENIRLRGLIANIAKIKNKKKN